ARQPDLAAALTSVPFPLILSTETARRSFETLAFFQKTTVDISRLRACASWCPAKLTRRGGLQTSSPKAFGVSSDTRSVKRSTQRRPTPLCARERSGQRGKQRHISDWIDRRPDGSKILADLDQKRGHGKGAF